MIFKLSTILTTLAIAAAPLVLALPNGQGKHLEARDLSPRHGTHGIAHHMRRSYSSPRGVTKRSTHRKRRTCPAAVSSSSDSIVATSTPTTSSEASSQQTTDSPASPAPSADPTQGAATQDSPAPAPAPAPAPSQPSNSNPDIQTYLDMHNNERAKHGASALTWADDLAAVAQSWANGCAFKHGGSDFGQNLSAGSGTSVSPSGAVQMWLNEAPSYDANSPKFSHWTQVVWKGTQELGCAVTTCSSESIFGTSAYGTAEFYVCQYRPAGNYLGQFGTNVQA